jgi:hypothetical protein
MNRQFWTALVVLSAVAATSQAATFSLLDYYTNNAPNAQNTSDLWTFQKSSASGAFLSPSGSYYVGDEPNSLPLVFGPVPLGYGSPVVSGMAGVFAHPGWYTNLAIVFRPQSNITFGSVTIFNDMADNGYLSNGLGVTVFYTKDNVTTQIGSRYTFDHASTDQPLETLRQLNLPVTLGFGDTVEIIFDTNGSTLYDHSITEIIISDVAAIPTPAALPAGLGLLTLLSLRRRSAIR